MKRVPATAPERDFAELAAARLDDERQMKHVLALVGRLPRREQEVFALCGWFNLSYEDGAFALEIPVGTVRSRLSRARARLRELEPAFGHEEDDNFERVQEVLEP